MKVVMVTGVFPPEKLGGVSGVAYHLHQHLINEGVDIAVLTTGKKSKNEFNIIRITRNVPFFILKTFLLFPIYYPRLKADIFHFQGNSGIGIIWWKLLYGSRFPKTITTLHSSQLREMRATKIMRINQKKLYKMSFSEFLFKYVKSPLNILFDIILCRLSDRIVHVCNATKLYCSRDYFIDEKKQTVIHNGIDVSKFTTPQNTNDLRKKHRLSDSPIILFVGVFKSLKGLQNLILAMPKVVKEITNVALIVVGGKWGYKEKLLKLVNRLKLDKHVLFVDKIPNNEMPKYYAAADVIAVPSQYEGFPLVVLEAMASARPVVASDVGGIGEAILDNQTGFLVEKDNINQLSDKIIQLLNTPKKREKMGNLARERVSEYFNWENIAKQYKLVYQELIK